jgi:hypothetical protein
MHPIVQQSMGRLEAEFRPRLRANTPADAVKRIDKFFQVHSSVAVWLNP